MFRERVKRLLAEVSPIEQHSYSFTTRDKECIAILEDKMKYLAEYIEQLRDKRGMFLILRRLIPEEIKTYIVATTEKFE